jgi:RHH-type proline utilization regulon transcriptional repressor/proline dehydrogenase/delta 1-pyrroline-5-carboxylate dehydrogenase
MEDFSPRDLAAIESTTQEVGRYIFDHLSHRQPSVLQRRWWDDRIMAWAMQDESVKVQMFRFIDVLPMLRSSEALVGHLHEYFEDVKEHLPSAVRLGLGVATPRSIAGRALAMAARRNAMGHARRFIAGTTTDEVLAAAMRARKLKRAFTLDILGEAVASEAEAEKYLAASCDLIAGIAPQVNAWPEVPQIDRGEFELLPRVNVSVKLSALDSQFDEIDPEGTKRRVAARLRKLLRVAREHRAFVNIDMESYRTKSLTLAIFKDVLMEEEFRGASDVGIVIQCYLRDAEQDLIGLRDWARSRGTPVWVRVVKGAYWDYETVHARAVGWPVPVFQEKWQSDANFERLSRFLLVHHRHLRPALASHNVRSLAHGIATARHIGLSPSAYEIQMLYGMGDPEKQVLVDLGHRVRIYMPYGELIPGMAYLVRRLLENTSNDSFLRASFTEQVAPEKLLMNPLDVGRERSGDDGQHPSGTAVANLQSGIAASAARPAALFGAEIEFQNEPGLDFALEENRQRMRDALSEVAGELGGHSPMVIGGENIDTPERLASLNPSHKRQVVGTTASATDWHVRQAVAAAREAWPAWADLGVAQRGEFLRRAAAVMRDRRCELAAWQIYECGKPWREADADVCEAIDFCEYYAACASVLQGEQAVDVPGEENRLHYLPRGVVGVIAPWNFPLAILTGMTVAALVTGNTVVMKPAEQSAIVAAKLMDIFRSVGLPAGVLNYLPGVGEVAGAELVAHPDVALIAFTGSRQVGLAINAKAAEVSRQGAPMVKRVIAEMGGKNAIIVDDDADLDEAVLGVVHSAFGYQGQKCSACSRAVVLAPVYDTFLERLVEATRSLVVAPAEEPGCRVGPVIDEEAQTRIGKYIEIGRQEGRPVLAVDVGKLADEGYYIGPHIFADVSASARIAQEEIFGPVLAVIRAENFDEALRIANGTEYALTGGVYSRSPAHLNRARREMMVGNLYLNRHITGALVNRQPFGGFKMSGIGSKAGGPDYLLQFVVPRTVTENTLRRGFAPSLERAGSGAENSNPSIAREG